jgi:hypothetical protein
MNSIAPPRQAGDGLMPDITTVRNIEETIRVVAGRREIPRGQRAMHAEADRANRRES